MRLETGWDEGSHPLGSQVRVSSGPSWEDPWQELVDRVGFGSHERVWDLSLERQESEVLVEGEVGYLVQVFTVHLVAFWGDFQSLNKEEIQGIVIQLKECLIIESMVTYEDQNIKVPYFYRCYIGVPCQSYVISADYHNW